MKQSTETPKKRLGRPPMYGPRVEITTRYETDFYEKLTAAAEEVGLSVNAFLNLAAAELIERMRSEPSSEESRVA